MSRHATESVVRPCTRVYLIMTMLTLATWAFGRTEIMGHGIALPVLAIALFKGHLVGDWFMGLRQVRGPWRWAVVSWLLLTGGSVAIAFLLTNGD